MPNDVHNLGLLVANLRRAAKGDPEIDAAWCCGRAADLLGGWLAAAEVLAPPPGADRPGAEVDRLRAAIRDHRDQRGDSRCWLDDLKLYRALDDGPTFAVDLALPPKCDFLESCSRYFRQRQVPGTEGTAPLPGDMTIAELTAEVERLRSAPPRTHSPATQEPRDAD